MDIPVVEALPLAKSTVQIPISPRNGLPLLSMHYTHNIKCDLCVYHMVREESRRRKSRRRSQKMKTPPNKYIR